MKNNFLNDFTASFITILTIFAIPYFLNEYFIGLESPIEYLYYCFFTGFIGALITYFSGEE